MSIQFIVNRIIDLQQDSDNPVFSIVYETNVEIKMIAKDCEGNILDLDEFQQIKIEAKKRWSSQDDPIFSASKINGKVIVTDADNGLYSVMLSPSDTSYIGEAKIQALYVANSGEVYKSLVSTVIFKNSFIEPD